MASAGPLPPLVGHGQGEIDGAIWDDASGAAVPCLCHNAAAAVVAVAAVVPSSSGQGEARLKAAARPRPCRRPLRTDKDRPGPQPRNARQEQARRVA